MLNYRFYILKHEFIQDSQQEKEKKEARKEEPSWVKQQILNHGNPEQMKKLAVIQKAKELSQVH